MGLETMEQRTLYVGLFSTLTGVSLVVSAMLGLLLQAVSFQVVFLLAMLAGIGSFILSLGLDPHALTEPASTAAGLGAWQENCPGSRRE